MEILLTILVFISLGGCGYTIWQQLQLQKKYGQFLKGADAKNIEKLVKNYDSRVKDSLTKLDELAGFCAKLHKTQQFAISKLALIRFNPFGDTGGDQSFVMALLNHHDDGLIISAVHARSGTRVYAKDVQSGQSRHHLSEEEKTALKQALDQDIK